MPEKSLVNAGCQREKKTSRLAYLTALLGTMIVMTIAVVGCATPSSPTGAPLSPTPAATWTPGVTASPIPDPSQPSLSNALRAGLRASPYGPQPPFPVPDYWANSAISMAWRFDGAAPAVVWIVGTMELYNPKLDDGNFTGRCQLNFPSPGGAYDNIAFSATDENAAYLDLFDQIGVQVWLQVESANADVSTLIDLVLGRYASHPSVIGFGVDVEWHKWSTAQSEGVAVTDAEAQAWSEQVRSYHPDYQIFFKHWLPSKMPPTYQTGVMFLDDSQMFRSMNQMVMEFEIWGRTFAPAPVGFQYGYEADQKWWRALGDPPRDIGQTLLEKIPNLTDLYWVDFTMEQIWSR